MWKSSQSSRETNTSQKNNNNINDNLNNNNTNPLDKDTQIHIQQFLDQQIDEFFKNTNTINTQQEIQQNQLSTSHNLLNNPKFTFTEQSKKTQLDPDLDSEKNITISIYNVRGANKNTKQNNIIAEMKERKIDILGISETRLPHTNLSYAFNDHKNYKCFASSNQDKPNGSGVAIIINKDLEKHVGHITKIDGHIIAIHMYFKKSKYALYKFTCCTTNQKVPNIKE